MNNTIPRNINFDFEYKIIEKFKLSKIKNMLLETLVNIQPAIQYVGELNKNDPML